MVIAGIFVLMNYYELFGIPVGLKINQVILNRTYIQLQKKYHPDFYGQASDEDKEFALEQSSNINKAYRAFKNPDLTLKYFLELKGLLEEGEQYKLPADFLMKVMDLNELKMDGVSQQEILSKAIDLQKEIFAGIKDLMEQYDDETTQESELIQLKDYYYKKKYIDRLLAE